MINNFDRHSSRHHDMANKLSSVCLLTEKFGSQKDVNHKGGILFFLSNWKQQRDARIWSWGLLMNVSGVDSSPLDLLSVICVADTKYITGRIETLFATCSDL